jgi:predicted DNA-binding transcriptional regulator AlpA
MDHVLNQKEAAKLLGVSTRTLERHRVTGTGPRFARIGRLIRYRPCDLSAYIERNLLSSTSDTSPKDGERDLNETTPSTERSIR